MEIKLTNEEKLNFFYNALCNGLGYFEGYGLELTCNPEDYDNAKATLRKDETQSICYEDVLIQILKQGNSLSVKDYEGDGAYNSSCTLETIYQRMDKVPQRFLLDMANEEDDAETADVILQIVFFEEIIFG